MIKWIEKNIIKPVTDWFDKHHSVRKFFVNGFNAGIGAIAVILATMPLDDVIGKLTTDPQTFMFVLGAAFANGFYNWFKHNYLKK